MLLFLLNDNVTISLAVKTDFSYQVQVNKEINELHVVC